MYNNTVAEWIRIYAWHAIAYSICVVCSTVLFAQQENISFEHFASENGLSAPVTNIVQDHYGFLWLGTTDGLNRFDGRNFIVYRNIQGDTSSLPNNIINGLCVDSTGRIWAATNGGLCYYNFSDNAFHTIEFNDTIEKIDQHRIHALTNSMDHGIWFATKTLLHKWQENQPVTTISLPLSANASVRCILEDRHQNVWIGFDLGLIVFNEQTGETMVSKFSSPFSIQKKLSVTVHPIIPFEKDTFLIGSWYGGLQKTLLFEGSIHSMPIIDEMETDPRKNIVTGISENASGRWWIGTYGAGLSLFDTFKGNFTDHVHHDPSDTKSLSDDYVNTIYTDDSGITWIGTGAGLDKYDPLTQQFKSISIPTTSDEFSVYRIPSSITEDINNRGWLWITVGGAGLYHYNTSTRHFILYHHDALKPGSIPDNSVNTLFYDNAGRIWIGMKSGLCLFDEKKEKFSIVTLPDKLILPAVHKILQEKNHTFWFATRSNGIYHYDEISGKITAYTYDASNPNSLPDNRVFCMIIDHDNKIWIGTQNRGMCRLDSDTGKIIYFQHDKNNPGSIPDNGIYDLYEDGNGQLWIATENGFAEMELKDFRIKNFTTHDGICNNDVFSITPDHQNHLWLATNNGLSKFDPATSLFKNYFIQDGLPTNSLSGSVCSTADGTLYFGSTGMISFCRPENMKMNKRMPNVVITNMKIFDQQAPVMRKEDKLLPVHLSYKENMITFDFAALNFTNSALNQYAYKLDGFNAEWIYCGNKQSATFTNLDGGTYTFNVKAANNDGVWNEAGAQMMLIVDPPYWKTWWFYLFCISFVAGTLYLLYRFRIQQLVKLQQIRLRISRDLHDDIGSTLSSINMISSMANRNEATEKKASELFQTISLASRQAMELMNDIVWSINPKNDRMEMIIIRMRQYASEMLEAAQISFSLSMEEECKQIILPVEKRKDFYLIFKEAINNLAKYSNADKAIIRLSFAAQRLTLLISDDGKGFDPTENFRGNGLKNMKARAEMLKGSISFVSRPGEGSTIILKFPAVP